MRVFILLYTALMLGANSGWAETDISALRMGDMRKLAIHDTPVLLADVDLVDGDDQPVSLSDYRGKWLVLNFWATWCLPCREEMPSLDRLQVIRPDIAVIPVATGRNPLPGIRAFFKSAEITHLPILRDPKSKLARPTRVLGLPVTLIVDPEGREIGRLIGDAHWDSPDALKILDALRGGS